MAAPRNAPTNGADSPRSPLSELIARLTALANSLERFAAELQGLRREIEGWTLCFHDSGELAGAVDIAVWDPAGRSESRSPGAADFQDYLTARREILVRAGLLPESELFVVGDGCEGNEWEAKAAKAGIPLPSLVRPLDIGSPEYDEAFLAWQTAMDNAVDEASGRPLSQSAILKHLRPPTSQLGVHGVTGQDVRFQGTSPSPSGPPIGQGAAAATIGVSDLAHDLRCCMQLVGHWQEHVDAAAEAAQQLLPGTLEALDGLHGRNWRAFFRRHVLTPVAGWRQPGSEMARHFPRHERELISFLLDVDPGPVWAAHGGAIEEAIVDLRAVTSESDRGHGQPLGEKPPLDSQDEPVKPGEEPASQTQAICDHEHPRESQEWSREMTKAEAGRLLRGVEGLADDTYRRYLKILLAEDREEVERSRPNSKLVQYRMDWVESEAPEAVANFRRA